MEPRDVINDLLYKQGRSRRSLARQVGMAPQTLDNLLTKARNMRIDRFVQLLDALGYDIRILPRATERPEYTLTCTGDDQPMQRADE